MQRRILLAGALSVLALAVPVPAAAGGGCSGEATTSDGETVEMAGCRFTPTTLQIEPGATVTFVNRDLAGHNVSAEGWGRIEEMAKGESFTATFADAGVYPFACTYHAGMTGAIVVAGATAGAAGGTPLGSAGGGGDAEGPARVLGTSTSPEDAGAWSELAAGAIGLVAGLGAGWFFRRRRALTVG